MSNTCTNDNHIHIFQPEHKERQQKKWRIDTINPPWNRSQNVKELHFKDRVTAVNGSSLEVSKNQTVIIMNTLCSWIAIFEQAATRYPTCVDFYCFGPVTDKFTDQYQTLHRKNRVKIL